eukprot:g9965.t1
MTSDDPFAEFAFGAPDEGAEAQRLSAGKQQQERSGESAAAKRRKKDVSSTNASASSCSKSEEKVDTRQPFVNTKAAKNGFRERWRSISQSHFQQSKPCDCFPELPLRLLFLGLNPSEGSWESGVSYGHPSNLFWKIVVEAGLVRLSEEEKQEVDENFAAALAKVQNRIPSDEKYRIGWSDLGCSSPGSEATEFSATLLADVWYPDFCRRGKAHVFRVRNAENADKFFRSGGAESGGSFFSGTPPVLVPEEDDSSAARGSGRASVSRPSAKVAQQAGGATATGTTRTPGSSKKTASKASSKQLFADIAEPVCDVRSREKLAKEDFANYKGPKIVAFTGRKQFLDVMQSFEVGGSAAGGLSSKVYSGTKFQYGKQPADTARKLLNWPFGKESEIWALPSTSGRAVLTREERYGPYKDLCKRLAALEAEA